MKKLSLLLALSCLALPAAAQVPYPVFKVDLSFNKQMPHGYFLGQVAGITEDSHGNIWVIHRPRRVVPQLDEPPKEASGLPAPSVVEYDAKGNFVRAWGGPFAMSKDELASYVRTLLEGVFPVTKGIRLLGVSMSSLGEKAEKAVEQLSLSL